MGGGGRMEKEDPLRRVPHEKPPFTLSQLKKAIPPHCFKRSSLRSFAYLAHDFFIYVTLLYLALYQLPSLPPKLRLVAWPLYWFAQGTILTGVWNLGHECGHNLFSESAVLDDVIGLVLHSFVLVPYFSWKYSHQRHHTNRGSIERDEVFVPKPRDALAWYSKYLNNPPGRVLTLALTLLLGWPLYLAVNASGRPYPRFASHYHPYGPIYTPNERAHVFISDAGIFGMLFLLYKAAMASGFWLVVRTYWVPYLVVNGWLVFITYLHHTHPSLPHYDSSAWDWLRGALGTVDRDYGWFNRIFHHITDAHAVHHIISTIPYYHAKEATEAIRPILGEYYRFDDTPVLKAMWREARECVYVEPDATGEKGVYWYRKSL